MGDEGRLDHLSTYFGQGYRSSAGQTCGSVPTYSVAITISGRLFCQKTCLPGEDDKEMTNSEC